ncbi:MAG: SDR family NAD(P)-dependent oxidoreductase [Arcicella sp.]|nr:SDR family NAD(P)-dependent oxidoreductase [Arcicella sp.]
MKDTYFIVTGAGSGIGQALAILAASKGAKVIATDIYEKGLKETREKVVAQNGWINTYRLDVADPRAITDFKEMIMEIYSPQKIILVNNAGVALYSGTFAETPMEDFDWLININLYGVIRMTKAFIPEMLAQNQGHIVNISSIFGIIGVPYQSAYCTAKFGVKGFSDVLKMELRDTDIKVLSVHPGGIKTKIASNAKVSENQDLRQVAADLEKFERESLINTPEYAAEVIIKGIEKGKQRILIGRDAKIIDILARTFPSTYHLKIPKHLTEKAKI